MRPARQFVLSYVPVPRLGCTRVGCGWSKELLDLSLRTVSQAERDHLATSHPPAPAERRPAGAP